MPRPDITAAVERILRQRPAISHAELTRLIREAAPVWAAVALRGGTDAPR